jgi:hypothetical protein
MRIPTLSLVASPVRRGINLTVVSFALAVLGGCDGTSPTEPDVKPSIDWTWAPMHKLVFLQSGGKTVLRPPSGIDTRPQAPRGF